MKTYISISTLCDMYEVDRKFFERRIKNGIFVLNKHYIKQANTVRFNISEIEKWWRSEDTLKHDAIMNKII